MVFSGFIKQNKLETNFIKPRKKNQVGFVNFVITIIFVTTDYNMNWNKCTFEKKKIEFIMTQL